MTHPDLKKVRRATWEHQQTFATPTQDRTRFVDLVVKEMPDLHAATVLIERIVFEPMHGLAKVREKYGFANPWDWQRTIIEADGADEARELLEATLSECVDFLYVPAPKTLVIYADHDEYITFFAHRKGPLSRLVTSLCDAGYRTVEWSRKP